PYTLRFEVVGKGGQAYRTRPHPDYVSNQVVIPPAPHTVRQLLKLIVAALPRGWQATEFVSHIILYRESRAYTHGKAI
ncbi:MAG: GIY-YIG nuclease family protein, partial [Methylocella sp.]